MYIQGGSCAFALRPLFSGHGVSSGLEVDFERNPDHLFAAPILVVCYLLLWTQLLLYVCLLIGWTKVKTKPSYYVYIQCC